MGSGFPMRCGYCGSQLHTLVNCPKTAGGQANRNRMYCGYCGAKDHNMNACPKTFQGNAYRSWHPELISNHFIKD